jgi:DNA processing protein
MPRPAGSEKLAWLRLARSPGVGPRSHARLIERFGSAGAALEALPGLLATGRWPGVALAPEEEALAELAAIETAGVRLLLSSDPDYPARLLEIADAPPVLLARGRVELLAGPSVAVVGARNASTHGRLMAAQLGRQLAAAGLAVVSGLARGIDTAAHEGALEGAGSTVAVLASGVDLAYPEENEGLLERIAVAGCALSERPLGAAPQARHFPRRNRIIAGLALGIVVVEAAPQSGSLITARLALEQGREVMAVPGSPLDPRHRGTNQLLRDGATLVENATDVLRALGPMAAAPARPQRPEPGPARVTPAERDPATAPGRGEPPTARARFAPAQRRPGDPAEWLLESLGVEPVAIDDLARQCQISPAVIQEAVLELELAGRVERHPGNRVARRAG